MDNSNRLNLWANELTKEELVSALVLVVDRMIDIEELCFYDGAIAPYWDGDGEPLVPGQEIHEV